MIKRFSKSFSALLVLSSFTLYARADYLLTVYEYQTTGNAWKEETKEVTFSRCIKDHFYDDANLYYLKSADNTLYARSFDNIKEYTIKSGYYLDDNGACVRYSKTLSNTTVDESLPLTSNNLSYLGLSDQDLNFAFAMSGVLLSFLFLFGMFRWI